MPKHTREAIEPTFSIRMGIETKRVTSETRPSLGAPDIDALVEGWLGGSHEDLARLVESLHVALRRLAEQTRRKFPKTAMSRTSLVNELFLQLSRVKSLRESPSPAEFLALCARIYARLLIEESRKRMSLRRGGGAVAVSLESLGRDWAGSEADINLALAVEQALYALEELHSRQATVVRLRFFAGLTFAEIGTLLKIVPLTAKRDWAAARCWLAQRLSPPAIQGRRG
jgi:RNA polymerase sigma factor (TIGR02999 family)